MRYGIVILIACVVALIGLSPVILDNIRYSDFAISGKVVDDTGEPLNDVGVKVIAGRSIKMGFESENDSRFDRVASVFHYKFNNYSIVSLRFFKEGFEEQRLHFTTGGRKEGIVVVLKRKAPTSQPESLRQ